MNHFNLDNALKSLKQIALKDNEKQSILKEVLSHAERSLPPESPYWHVWIWNYSMVRRVVVYFTIALIVLATSSGGVVSAAEKSLPGDPLYNFKVNFTEPLGVVLAIGSNAKAKLVAKFASRRLAEAETLAAQGRLDAVKAHEIKVRFVKHAEMFSALEKKVELSGNSGVALDTQTKFDQNINAHVELMQKVKEATDIDQKKNLENVESTLRKYLNLIPIPIITPTSSDTRDNSGI